MSHENQTLMTQIYESVCERTEGDVVVVDLLDSEHCGSWVEQRGMRDI